MRHMLCVLMSFVIPFLVLPCMTRSIAEKGLMFHNRTLNIREEFCFLVLEFYLHLFVLPRTWIEQNIIACSFPSSVSTRASGCP